MDFGMPTLMEFQSITENCALARQLGLDFVELNMNLPYCTIDALRESDLPSLAKKHHLYFTIHADENLFFCDFNRHVADAHLSTMLETIKLCKSSDIPLVNFHMSSGVYFSLPDGKHYLFDAYPDHYKQRLNAFRDACEKAAGSQVALCIENTGLSQGFILKGMEFLLASPAFHLTWDIGHDYSAGNIDSPFILSHLDRLLHMHIHGAMGQKNHLSLSGSELDWHERLRIGDPKRAVIEVKTSQFLIESVSVLRRSIGGA